MTTTYIYWLLFGHITSNLMLAISSFVIAYILNYLKRWIVLDIGQQVFFLFTLFFMVNGVGNLISIVFIWYRMPIIWIVIRIISGLISLYIAAILYRMFRYTRKVKKVS